MDDVCIVENLSFSYSSSKRIIDNLSFQISNSEIVGILGKNGSGKTTLINLMTGFLKNYSGSITIRGKNIEDYSLKERARNVSYIQQSHLSIPDYYCVEDFVLEGRRPFTKFGFYTDDDYELLETVLKQCSLETYKKQHINEISGGELQRCVFAKALMKQCGLFIFDEPTSAMDIKYQKEFFELISIAKQELNAAIVLSIHDINISIKYCDRLIVLNSGKILYDGKSKLITKEILSEAFDTLVSEECTDPLHFYY